MAELGVRGATVRVIASEAGVSTGFVMHYFPDKEHLLDAVLEHNTARAAGRVFAVRRRQRGTEGLAALLETLLPLDADRRLEWQVWSAYWTHAQPSDGTAQGIERLRHLLADLLVTCLRDAVGQGEFRADLDLNYEAERLIILAGGLGLFSGGTMTATAARKLARQMIDDHIETLTIVVPAP